jgi:hypothetical protein
MKMSRWVFGRERRGRAVRAAAITGRPLLLVAGMVIGGAVTGFALADAGAPAGGGYVSITPVKVLSGASVAAGKSVSPVAIGGSTTVPTNATAVRLTVAVKAAKSGSLRVYPAGDPTAAGATAFGTTAGVTTTQTIDETVGTKDQVTLLNASAGAATVTVTVSGYSTQVTAGNIAPDGGVSGQVLSNNGNGVGWAAGSVSVNTGSGLTGGGSVPLGGSRTLSVDPTAVQQRVTGTCGDGSAVSSVNQDGSVGCHPTGAKTVAGIVNPDGSVAAGSGFSVTRNAAGDYTITIPAGTFNGVVPPAITVTPWGLDGHFPAADIDNEGAAGDGSATIRILISSSVGATNNVDNGFEFIAIQA